MSAVEWAAEMVRLGLRRCAGLSMVGVAAVNLAPVALPGASGQGDPATSRRMVMPFALHRPSLPRDSLVLAVVLSVPILAFVVLRLWPTLDVGYNSVLFHLLIVSGLSACALVVAVLAAVAAGRTGHRSLTLLGAACLDGRGVHARARPRDSGHRGSADEHVGRPFPGVRARGVRDLPGGCPAAPGRPPWAGRSPPACLPGRLRDRHHGRRRGLPSSGPQPARVT